jgi:hypothetical protein
MIYVVKTRGINPAFIKIGTASKSMSHRMKSLQTGCPHPLDLIYAENGGLKEEKLLHDKLKEHRIMGEWFKWNNEAMELFGLKENPKVLNPDSPQSFLTPNRSRLTTFSERATLTQLTFTPLKCSYLGTVIRPKTFEISRKGKRSFVFLK